MLFKILNVFYFEMQLSQRLFILLSSDIAGLQHRDDIFECHLINRNRTLNYLISLQLRQNFNEKGLLLNLICKINLHICQGKLIGGRWFPFIVSYVPLDSQHFSIFDKNVEIQIINNFILI